MTPIDAKKIIEALADGIDPETGEVLPNNTPLSQPQIIRALFLAAKSLGRIANKDTPNAGQPWTDTELKRLFDAFDKGIAIEQIAKMHGRTTVAIEAQLGKHGRVIDNQPNYSNTSRPIAKRDDDIPF